MDFIFKEMCPNDLIKVMEIEKLSFSPETWEDESVYINRFSTFPQGNLTVWRNNEIVGFICSELWTYDSTYPNENFTLSHDIKQYHDYLGTVLYISSFAISPTCRGGLGKKVFNTFIQLMFKQYKLKSSILLVSDEWEKAKSIYNDMGYVKISSIPDFFIGEHKKQWDGIIMRKEL